MIFNRKNYRLYVYSLSPDSHECVITSSDPDFLEALSELDQSDVIQVAVNLPNTRNIRAEVIESQVPAAVTLILAGTIVYVNELLAELDSLIEFYVKNPKERQ